MGIDSDLTRWAWRNAFVIDEFFTISTRYCDTMRIDAHLTGWTWWENAIAIDESLTVWTWSAFSGLRLKGFGWMGFMRRAMFWRMMFWSFMGQNTECGGERKKQKPHDGDRGKYELMRLCYNAVNSKFDVRMCNLEMIV